VLGVFHRHRRLRLQRDEVLLHKKLLVIPLRAVALGSQVEMYEGLRSTMRRGGREHAASEVLERGLSSDGSTMVEERRVSTCYRCEDLLC